MSIEYSFSLPGSRQDTDRAEDAYASRLHRPGVLPFRLVEPATIFAELVIVVLASVASGVGYHWLFLGGVGAIETYLALGLLVFVNVAAISAARGNYRPISLLNKRRQVRDVTLVWLFVCLVLLGVAFSLKITESFSRGDTITFFVLGGSAVTAWRGFAGYLIRRALAEGAFAERKIVVLAEEGQLASSKMLLEFRRCGYKPAKIFKIKRAEMEAIGVPSSLRTTLDDVIETSRNQQIEDLFLLLSWDHRRCIEEIFTVLQVLPVPVHLVPDENVARFLTNRLVNVGDAWTAELKRAPLTVGERAIKRSCDFLASGIGIVLLAPLLVITALLVKLDFKGPVLFCQTRNGFNGRSFRIFKFRSMSVLEDGPVIVRRRRTTHASRGWAVGCGAPASMSFHS